MKYQTIAVLAFSTLLPAIAAGQFTTVVTPPKPRADSVKAVVAQVQQRVATDSVARVAITNMKAWVDSAAGDVVVNRTDSTGRPIAATGQPVTAGTPTPAGRPVTPPESTMTFSEGARAPSTATWLPLLMLVGTSAIGLGVIVLRWRPGA